MPVHKECKTCGRNLPLTQFNKGNWKYGVRNRCKECRRIERQSPEYKQKQRNWNLLKNYSISTDEYDSLFERQGCVCAICGNDNPKSNYGTFCVDHCHTTGVVRGILCQPCNTALGLFMDDVVIIKNAYKYLQKYESDS